MADQSEQSVPLSVCVTTKNVDETIGRCLESVSGWVEEIVVLDSNSQDDTLAICERYGASIYQHEFRGFADLKRSAIDKAQNEWVLLLDADEEVSEPLRSEIQEVLQSPNAVAFEIPLNTYMFGGRVRTSQTKTCLFKRDVIEFKQDYIHEKMSVPDQYQNQVSVMSNSINHYTYNRVSEHVRKFDQYTALEALRYVDSGEIPSYPRFLAKAAGVCLYFLFVNRAILDGYRGVLFAMMSLQYQLVIHAKIKDIGRLKLENPNDWKDIWLKEECQR